MSIKIRVWYNDPHECGLITWVPKERDIPEKLKLHRIEPHTITEFLIDRGDGLEPYTLDQTA
jgi:hypothetical protein